MMDRVIGRIRVSHAGCWPSYHEYEALQIFSGLVALPGSKEEGKIPLDLVPESAEFALEWLDETGAVRERRMISEANEKSRKREIYQVLQEWTGYASPWGCMTGIRPAKIVNQLREQGLSDAEIDRELADFYLVREDKRALARETAYSQDVFLARQKENPRRVGIYVGIPFCPTRCVYCSFPSYSIVKYRKQVGAYLDALEQELSYLSQLVRERNLTVESLYLGGGTPTSLSEEDFTRYMDLLVRYFPEREEFSLEAGRPDSISVEKLRRARSAGVNRISINPQSMNNETLKLIGRCHNQELVCEAFALAREEGFDNINMDVIAGLPGEDEADFARTLERVGALGPDSITVHTLSIKHAAYLREDQDKRRLLRPEKVGGMISQAAAFARTAGMHPYYLYRQKNMLGNHENVAYCRKSCESPYNIHIMEEDQSILAAGAGGVTKVVFPDGRIERAFNVKGVEDFLARWPEMIDRKRSLMEEWPV